MPEIIDVIVEYDAIPELIKLIKNQFTFEKTIEILATMITQKPDELREIYLNLEIIVPILTSFSPHDVSTFNADVRTILANLFEEKHRPKKSDINLLIPIWSKLIYEFDASTIIKTIETVGHLAKEDKDLEKYVIDKNVIYSMVQLINHHELYIHQFLTIGLFYVTKGSAEQIQHTFDSGLLKYFDTLLHHPDETVHLLAVILISNVINKNEEQYQAVFDTKYIPLIMEYFKSDETQKRQVASKFFTKAIIHGKTEHILRFLKMNVVCFLSKHLKEHENDKDESWADRIEVILKSFQNIFDKIPKPLLKDVSLEIIKCGGNDVITRFVKQESSDEISQLAIKIIYEMGRAMNVLDENDALRKEL
uniref:Uncharacterized protein n=1 Tax=Panagrolaimus sp. ES5 TaxID=591445 RepID=A0AC34G6P8_9BILA